MPAYTTKEIVIQLKSFGDPFFSKILHQELATAVQIGRVTEKQANNVVKVVDTQLRGKEDYARRLFNKLEEVERDLLLSIMNTCFRVNHTWTPKKVKNPQPTIMYNNSMVVRMIHPQSVQHLHQEVMKKYQSGVLSKEDIEGIKTVVDYKIAGQEDLAEKSYGNLETHPREVVLSILLKFHGRE